MNDHAYIPTVTLDRGEINTALGWWADAHPNGGATWDTDLAHKLGNALDGDSAPDGVGGVK